MSRYKISRLRSYWVDFQAGRDGFFVTGQMRVLVKHHKRARKAVGLKLARFPYFQTVKLFQCTQFGIGNFDQPLDIPLWGGLGKRARKACLRGESGGRICLPKATVFLKT